jgi:hypothetical protein
MTWGIAPACRIAVTQACCCRLGRDVGDVVGLVHDAECDLGLRRVLGGNLAPQAGQLRVCGPALNSCAR